MSSFGISRSISLIGMMGAGKTTIGRALAKALDVPFYDSDAEIEARSQQTIEEIFDLYGEGYFRQKEKEVIENILKKGVCVLSTGGGAYIHDQTRSVLDEKTTTVWLRASFEELFQRVSARKKTMPMLKDEDPETKFRMLFEQRNPFYSRAMVAVDSSGVAPKNVVESVLKKI